MSEREPVTREPIFNVPATVLAILAVFVAVHVVLNRLDEANFTWWVLALAFVPARYSGLASQLPGGNVAAATSFVTHQAVHVDLIHLLFNSAWLLAFGAVLCRRLGGMRFLLFSILSGVAGATLFLLLHIGLEAPVIGASGAIAGMMGGVMRFLFTAIDRRQGHLLRETPADIPRMDLSEAIRDRRIVLATASFVAINLLAIFGFGNFGAQGGIAWEAHLGGYFFGLLTFGFFDSAPQKGSPNSFEVV